MKKRIIAILLSAMLCLSLLAGCSGSGTTDTGLIVDGKKVEVDSLISVGDVKVPFDVYRYFYLYFKNAMDSGNDAYWSNNEDSAKNLKTVVEENIKYMIGLEKIASELGVAMGEEDKASVQSTIDEVKASYDSEDAYNKALVSANMTADSYYWILEHQYLNNKVLETYFAAGGGNELSTEDFRQIMDKEYVRVKHILLAEKDSSGNDQQAFAEELLQKAKNGEDFDTLITNYNTDPGMMDNKDGYYFTYGEMVTEFEKASFALKEGEYTMVKSSYGYHIIQRLPFDETYITTNIESMLNSYKSKLIYNLALVKCGEASYNDLYEKVSPSTMK